MDVILYRSDDGAVQLDVQLERETVWLNQCQMAELFDKDTDTIGLHFRNIYKEGELPRKGTTEESSVVQNEGGRKVRRQVSFYNLDVIISVGYRVSRKRPPICFTSWSRTTPSATATNALVPLCSSLFWSATTRYIATTAPSGLPTMRWWP